jgi:hypothetical protein
MVNSLELIGTTEYLTNRCLYNRVRQYFVCFAVLFVFVSAQ